MLISSYRQSYYSADEYPKHGTAIASVRAGNVIGGGDWAVDRLVPDIIRAVKKNEVVNIRNPQAIRPWQHVLEPLIGYIKLAEQLFSVGAEFAEAWNFGPCEDDAQPVQWLAEKFTDLWGKGFTWNIDNGEQLHEAHYLKLDCSKARARLNWRPKWNLQTAIKAVIDWHKAEISGENLKLLCLTQIADYQSS